MSPKTRASERTGELFELLQNHVLLAVVALLSVSWFSISGAVWYFEKGAQGGNLTSYGDSLWWGIVTLLTVGYGDRYPVTMGGRFFAGVLMCAGVTAVGIVTAKISSIFLERALREARGVVDTHHLKDHFIVCGWKSEIHLLLEHVLDFNPDLGSDHLVLVANVTPAQIEELHAIPRLAKLKVLVGDFFSETTLKRAAPDRCRKLLILADQTPNAGGQRPTNTETDARTVMAAMTLANIARGVNVAAEILDPKMDQYLKIANVNEIIYTREYSRLLLGNASSGTGVMNVIHELLDPATPTFLTTHPIEEALIHSSYAKLREAYREKEARAILVGVIENSGNSHQLKELALRKAQQTPDVSKLVDNLRSVKEMKFNRPVFNPPDDYKLGPGSMAIVIESREARP